MRVDYILRADLNLLPALAALLDERQVSRAAARVGISQPAMSRTLQRLRDVLGDDLLVRYNLNGIELNEEGFEKLREEINLEAVEMNLEMPWTDSSSQSRSKDSVAQALLPVPAAHPSTSKRDASNASQHATPNHAALNHASSAPELTTLYYGEVPMGDSVELLVVRKAQARELLPDGKIGGPHTHPYYEICTSPALYTLVAALIRTNQATPA